MNDLDEIIYALEDLKIEDLNTEEQNYKILTNTGDTGGPQGNFRDPQSSTSVKMEGNIPKENFLNKSRKSKNYVSQYHDNIKAKYIPNRIPPGDAGTQLLNLDCKRESRELLELWGQNLKLFFCVGKGITYTSEEKIILATYTFTGKVHNWYKGLSEESL